MAEQILLQIAAKKATTFFLYMTVLVLFFGCQKREAVMNPFASLEFSKNALDYSITPKDAADKSGLMFSDQGAWFAYSFPDSTAVQCGFSGPFLLTQQNGIWASQSISKLSLKNNSSEELLDWKTSLVTQNSFNSHLEQTFDNKTLQVSQELVFLSGNTALQRIIIKNSSEHTQTIHPSISGNLFDIGISIHSADSSIEITSKTSLAKGYLKIWNEHISIKADSSGYMARLDSIVLKSNQTKEYVVSQSFIFPEYSWEDETALIGRSHFDSVLKARKIEKESQLHALISKKRATFSDTLCSEVLAKAQLTLQNNWRIPAGEIKYAGLFPSYHYKWFNGFWSWDSWKHAVGLSYYDTALAKDQIKLMFEFQDDNGFVADCVFRDTLIEKHNYRDTKPPLATWAVAKIYEKDQNISFVKELYPKLKKYHYWWYLNRDHDQDGLCEFGSTDGSLIAAKWESGMDNAIRFDTSEILKNGDNAYSLNQESVDLNAYLYAEKIYLATLAEFLKIYEDADKFQREATRLKKQIQDQFYDETEGWFYDTSLDGTTFIKGEGSEGWTALWAKAATNEQAESVKNKMMDPSKFYTMVPFQTMSADHEKFNPLKGYWRGPNWLDQAYFGVQGLRNYGFNEEANSATKQIIIGAEGLLEKGTSIRENYHPLTGIGLNAENFSWSAAHIIMLLIND